MASFLPYFSLRLGGVVFSLAVPGSGAVWLLRLGVLSCSVVPSLLLLWIIMILLANFPCFRCLLLVRAGGLPFVLPDCRWRLLGTPFQSLRVRGTFPGHFSPPL